MAGPGPGYGLPQLDLSAANAAYGASYGASYGAGTGAGAGAGISAGTPGVGKFSPRFSSQNLAGIDDRTSPRMSSTPSPLAEVSSPRGSGAASGGTRINPGDMPRPPPAETDVSWNTFNGGDICQLFIIMSLSYRGYFVVIDLYSFRSMDCVLHVILIVCIIVVNCAVV